MLKQVDNMKYRLVRHIATLSEKDNFTTELNVISYNEYKPKLDLRKWKKNGDKKQILRGLTLTDDEAKELYKALGEYIKAIEKDA